MILKLGVTYIASEFNLMFDCRGLCKILKNANQVKEFSKKSLLAFGLKSEFVCLQSYFDTSACNTYDFNGVKELLENSDLY